MITTKSTIIDMFITYISCSNDEVVQLIFIVSDRSTFSNHSPVFCYINHNNQKHKFLKRNIIVLNIKHSAKKHFNKILCIKSLTL